MRASCTSTEAPAAIRSVSKRGVGSAPGATDIAAARYSFGKGVVVLSGPHPEADEDWFKEAGIPSEKMPERDLLRSLVTQLGR